MQWGHSFPLFVCVPKVRVRVVRGKKSFISPTPYNSLFIMINQTYNEKNKVSVYAGQERKRITC